MTSKSLRPADTCAPRRQLHPAVIIAAVIPPALKNPRRVNMAPVT
jgi:hypothetical protein